MAEQLVGIADHPEAPVDGQVGHGRHHGFVHLAGEIAVKGFPGEVTGIGNAASIAVDWRAADAGRDHQRPAKGVPEVMGQAFEGIHHIQAAAARAGEFIG